MLGLPKTTEYNRRFPKQKFYDNIKVTPELRRVFIDVVKVIYWRNKIAATTINLSVGKNVEEIEVFEIRLNGKRPPEEVLEQIDKQIPYHIVFLLEFEGKYQAWTAYKESTVSGNNAFKVGSYYHTEWLDESELPLKLEGLELDKVYENFVRQIHNSSVKNDSEQWSYDETLSESIAKEEERKKLEKQIAALQVKIRKEKQLNKQVQMNADLKKLKTELENLVQH